MVSYSPLWRLRSKGAILTLFQDFVVITTALLAMQTLFELYIQKNESLLQKLWLAGLILIAVLFAITFPVAGWLSDAYYGRFKVRRFGLCLMWAGLLCATIINLVYQSPKDYNKYMFIISTSSIALVSTGFAAYAVNAVQFGIDQMPDASSDELCAYIHWVVWIKCTAGSVFVLIDFTRFCMDYPLWHIFQLMVPMTMLSLALCCEFLLRGWLIIEPGCPNSLRMIYRVLKFAVTHKYPIRRRAITYTEEEKPSRIDFAKDKYGGPFTTEQVEDVKTFFRIVVVHVSTATFLIPILLMQSVGSAENSCSSRVGKQFASSVPTLAMEIILLYSLVIRPLLRKQMLTTLYRVVLAAILSVLVTAASLIVQVLEPNAFNVCGTNNPVSMNDTVIVLVNLAIAVDIALFFTAIFEFTCAQSPYHMRGLLFGLLYSIIFLSIFIYNNIFRAWKYTVKKSCDFYYILFQFLCAVVGLIVLCVFARWYKRRRREEEDDQRRIVEEIYDRMLQNRSCTN